MTGLSKISTLLISYILISLLTFARAELTSKVGEPYQAEGDLRPITEEENIYLTRAMKCVQRGDKIPAEVFKFISSSKKLMKMLKTLHLKNLEKRKDYGKRRFRASREALKNPARPGRVKVEEEEEDIDEV